MKLEKVTVTEVIDLRTFISRKTIDLTPWELLTMQQALRDAALRTKDFELQRNYTRLHDQLDSLTRKGNQHVWNLLNDGKVGRDTPMPHEITIEEV